MDTSEIPGGGDVTNNTSPLLGATNPLQVPNKHRGDTIDVEQSDPNKHSQDDPYDRTENMSSI